MSDHRHIKHVVDRKSGVFYYLVINMPKGATFYGELSRGILRRPLKFQLRRNFDVSCHTNKNSI